MKDESQSGRVADRSSAAGTTGAVRSNAALEGFIHAARGLLNTVVLNISLLRNALTARDGGSDAGRGATTDKSAEYLDAVERDVRALANHIRRLDPSSDESGEPGRE